MILFSIAEEYSPYNSNARYRKPYTLEQVLNSPYVSEPLRLLEICATSDGAAAMVLSSMKKAKSRIPKPVTIATATIGTGLYGDPTLRVPCISARQTHVARGTVKLFSQ